MITEAHNQILNEGLSLALEWGTDWLSPINQRLSIIHPELTTLELARYDSECREAMNFGHQQVATCWIKAAPDEAKANQLFEQSTMARFPWISPANLRHIHSQGCYYAWKDGIM